MSLRHDGKRRGPPADKPVTNLAPVSDAPRSPSGPRHPGIGPQVANVGDDASRRDTAAPPILPNSARQIVATCPVFGGLQVTHLVAARGFTHESHPFRSAQSVTRPLLRATRRRQAEWNRTRTTGSALRIRAEYAQPAAPDAVGHRRFLLPACFDGWRGDGKPGRNSLRPIGTASRSARVCSTVRSTRASWVMRAARSAPQRGLVGGWLVAPRPSALQRPVPQTGGRHGQRD